MTHTADNAIVVRLRRLRRRARCIVCVSATAKLVLLGAAILACCFAADRFLDLPPSGRVTAAACGAAAILAGVYAWLVRPLALPLSAHRVAQALEQRHPSLKGLLLSAEEFSRFVETPSNGSATLAAATLEHALASGQVRRSLRTRVPAAAVLLWLAAAVTVSGVATTAIRFDRTSGLFIARFSTPYAAPDWPRGTRFLVTVNGQRGGPIVVPQGTGISVEAVAQNAQGKADWQPPRTARARLTARANEQTYLLRRYGRERYRATLTNPGASGELIVEAADAYTERLELVVAERPVIRLASVSVTFPPYTGLDAWALPPGEGDVTAPVGSTLALVARVSKPVDEHAAALVVNDETTVPMSVANDAGSGSSTIRAKLGLKKGMTRYHLQATDRQGVPSARPRVYLLKVVEDRAPVVRIRQPEGESLRLTPDAVLPVLVSAEDDHGVSKIALMMQPEEGDAAKTLADQPLPGPLQQNVQQQIKLQLQPLALQEGTAHALWAEAVDNRAPAPPNRSRSRRIALSIISREKAATEMIESQQAVLAKLDRALDSLRTGSNALQEAKGRLSASPAQTAKAAGHAQSAASATRQSSRTAEAAKADVQRLLWQMDTNRLARPLEQRRLAKADKALSNLLQQAYPRALDAVAAARQQIGTPQAQAKLDAAEEAQARLSQALASIRAALSRSSSVDPLIKNVQQLIENETATAEQTRRLAAGLIGKRREDLSGEERASLDAAAARQAALAAQAQQVGDALKQWERTAELPKDTPSLAAAYRAAGIPSALARAARSIAASRPSSAVATQQQALGDLRNVLDQLLKRRDQLDAADSFVRQMAADKMKLQSLLAEQERLAEATTAEQNLQRSALAGQQRSLAQKAKTAAERLKNAAPAAAPQDQQTAKAAAAKAAAAAAAMEQAAKSIAAPNREQAQQAQQQAAASLRAAIDQLDTLADRARERKEVRAWTDVEEQLRDVLRHHTAVHRSVDALSEALAAGRSMTRPEEMAMRANASKETEMAGQLGKVVDRLAPLGAPVVSHMIHATAEGMNELADRLRLPDVGPVTVHEGEVIAANLSQVLQMLGPLLAEARKNMAEGPRQDKQRDQPQKVVPPRAEVRLLRSIQEGLLDKTRRAEADRIRQALNPVLLDKELQRLSDEQQQAARLARELLLNLLTPPTSTEPEDK